MKTLDYDLAHAWQKGDLKKIKEAFRDLKDKVKSSQEELENAISKHSKDLKRHPWKRQIYKDNPASAPRKQME